MDAQGSGWMPMLIISPPGKAPPAPISSPGPGQWSHGPQEPLPPFCSPLPAPQSCTARRGPAFLPFHPFSQPLNALCLLWRRRAGRAPLPLTPPEPGDPPQQMGPGCECARSAGPIRGFAGAPFIARLCVLLRCAGTPPELSPGSLPFPSRRKESAYKGLVCPTRSEGTILL